MKAVLSTRLAPVSQQHKKISGKRKEVVLYAVMIFHFTFVVGISWGHLCKA